MTDDDFDTMQEGGASVLRVENYKCCLVIPLEWGMKIMAVLAMVSGVSSILGLLGAIQAFNL